MLLDEILLVGRRRCWPSSEVLIAPVNSGSCYATDALSPDWRGVNGLIDRILDIGVQLTMSSNGINEKYNQMIIIKRVQTESKY